MNGTAGFVAAPRGEWAPQMFAMLAGGRQLRGILGGDAHPGLFMPKLAEFWRQGRFPFDRLLTFYPFAEIARAFDDAHSGKAIKPVLLMEGVTHDPRRARQARSVRPRAVARDARRHQQAVRRDERRDRPGDQGDARPRLRPRRAQPARPVRARRRGGRPGAGVRPRRRVRDGRQAHRRQPVLLERRRIRRAAGLGRRADDLSPGARAQVSRRAPRTSPRRSHWLRENVAQYGGDPGQDRARRASRPAPRMSPPTSRTSGSTSPSAAGSPARC